MSREKVDQKLSRAGERQRMRINLMGLGFLIKETKCPKFGCSLDSTTLNRYQVFSPSNFLETGSPNVI